MTRDEARQEIRSRYNEYLKPAKKPGTYICPLCGNGTGATGDGLSIDPHGDGLHMKCFKCGFYGDLIDLYQKETGCSQQDAFSGLYRRFNISVDDYTQTARTAPTMAQAKPQAQRTHDMQETSYAEYFIEASKRLEDPDAQAYLFLRGISKNTAERFMLGYDPAWRSPTAVARGKNPPTSPRLIIPTGGSSYIARDTRKEIPEAAKAFAKMKEGDVCLFHDEAIYNDQERPVFITEGEIDALSIMEAGHEAAALGSISNTRKLLEMLDKKPTKNTLILCLDNDDAGRKAEDKLAEELQRRNVSFVRVNVCGNCKDPNEALTTDRVIFADSLDKAEERTSATPDSIKNYLGRIFAGEIEKFKKSSNRKTGFDNLDKVAGGIYPGLYVLGAISSLGKTTLIHQIADQMAAAGEHVLFFSLEQSRFEMASKSLARMTAQKDIATAVSSLEIRKGRITKEVTEAYTEYAASVGDRLSIIEGNFNCNISFIGEYVNQYMNRNRVKPVVVVDYLQILDGAADQHQTAKDIVDTNVRELKRLSRNADIPVFVISSLNRSNYLTPVDFESFKESGGIEYTADVIWGLQLSVMNDDLFNSPNKIKEKREAVKRAKAANPRQIQLVCLKNRYGVSSYTANFLYHPANDLFVEDNSEQEYNSYEPYRQKKRNGGKSGSRSFEEYKIDDNITEIIPL